MAIAQLIENGTDIIVKFPYNASLVSDIKALPGRKYDPQEKVWSVSGRFSKEVRAIVAKYFQIEGEESKVEHEVLDLIVWADNTYKRSYPHGVTVDGCDVVNMTYGNLIQKSNAFEILEEKGGFTRGDSRHAFEVRYEIKVRVRKGAVIEGYGRCGKGEFKIAKDAAPVVESVKVRMPRAKKVSPLVAQLQIPEGKKARLVGGKIVIK
jgi:septum formation topological specificity factor MinE